MFLVALCLSAVAAFYSIVGLTAIFAAAATPIILMGGILEVAKLTVTVWLHEHWDRARWLMKVYLCSAVVVLMLITSMGIFGFLSKAHMDQSLVGGDVQAKIAIYDEKIKTEKENIETARRALKQMDEAVDQVLGRSTSETGADRAVALRRTQQKERGRLLADISQSQKSIAELNEARAPIAAEIRKVEAEVGPIKYIAALVYDDTSDTNTLEAAVRWVIILLVVVFDPLAVMMLLAVTESRKWNREPKPVLDTPPRYEPDDGPLIREQIEEIKESVKEDLPVDEITVKDELFPQDPSPPGWMYPGVAKPEPEKSVLEQHPYINQPFAHFNDLTPVVHNPEPLLNKDLEESDEDLGESYEEESPEMKIAMHDWKMQNPYDTLKRQRQLLERGKIDHLPWLDLLDKPVISTVFGNQLPENPSRGDTFINTDYIPTRLFKFNGEKWIEIDKSNSDSYTYDIAYIDFLIAGVSSGEYDTELLTESERNQIETRLRENLK
jgi:hypothetical protein